MAQQRHLKNAPITEALIDIRVKLPDEFEISQFEPIKKEIENQYPIFEEQRSFKHSHAFKEGKPKNFSFEDMGVQGFFFKTADKIKIAQFRLDGFTFNHLKPYSDWETIFEEARRLWTLYKEITSLELITRLAVRYINHLKLPLPIDNFADFFTAPPTVPEGLPQSLIKFQSRNVIIEPENQIIANITQASDEKGSDSQNLNVILDIDTLKNVNYRAENKQMWDIFENLRKMKNDIFFKSLTEKTVRLFE